MIVKRARDARGRTRLDWLDSRHTFSFGDYHDPDHPGFRALRVINEDRIQPGTGFGTHPHRDMEILTVVLSGMLEHRDSLGNGSRITAGEVQRMTAGTGVTHSEFNPASDAPVHLLQIWILPERRALTPGYEQRTFTEEERRGALRLIASRDGGRGALTIHQDVSLHAGTFDAGETASFKLEEGRHAWVQVARGAITLNGIALVEGDGAAVSDERNLGIRADRRSEILVFDLA